MSQVVRVLRAEDYEASERDRTVTLTELGEAHVEELLNLPLRDPERPEDVTPQQARLLGYLEQALRAQYLFKRNKDYLVQAGKVVIVDEFTGRLMPGRRWSDGLHQAVEAKEGVRVQAENVTYATITIQNYFRMYQKLAGMSGTSLTEAEEFDKIYKLGVVAIPTNLEFTAMQPDSGLVELEGRDEEGYKYDYYAKVGDTTKEPIFWKRKDYPDVVYRSEEAKLRAIMQEILSSYVIGRPVLVGTTSVELSDRVSARLRAEPLRRIAQVLLLRRRWFERNQREEDGRAVAELQYLNTQLDQLDLNAMRKMARDLEIPFNPEEPTNLARLLKSLEVESADPKRLAAALQGGIPHQVLNARKHTEESQIIAGAGAFGAITIATNMAGRGVDIKLGGELSDTTYSAVNRLLRRAGYADPYDMTLEERHQALLSINPADFGIYEVEVQAFLDYIANMENVRTLGGLHVIGSERHEARRIDNQLRGRSARQGDPGSSRFYLSMEDDLMRLFGGEQADGLMQRLKIDDALPLEVGLVSRLIEQSQTRVEGANFDVRKHLLEYDDVLNSQRLKIYAQRERIFTKDDLSEDVTEMLRAEVANRVPAALLDDEGPWKLLAWLDQVQPPLMVNSHVFPSYSLRLLFDRIQDQYKVNDDQSISLDRDTTLKALLEVAQDALAAEEQHLLKAVDVLLEQSELRLESQLNERLESVDTFIDGLEMEEEGDEQRNPRQRLEELSAILRLPIKLSNEQQRDLLEDPRQLSNELRLQVENLLFSQASHRLIGAVERRLEEPLELGGQDETLSDWQALGDRLIASVQELFARRRERLLGNNGSETSGLIRRDLEAVLQKYPGPFDKFNLLQLLLLMPQGARTEFDKKTHRKVQVRTNRLVYSYLAGQLLQGRDPQETAEDVLSHLEQAQETIKVSLGVAEWNRVAGLSMAEFPDFSRRGFENALGEDTVKQVITQPLHSLDVKLREKLVPELGRQALTATYRQLLLAVITELWVEYLTQMEGLRVSIGLEAYAQRDPLVQYKNKASELFQELLSNMRLGVVSRMFTFRPREASQAQPAASRIQPGADQPVAEEPAEASIPIIKETATSPGVDDDSNKKRRRRKRH